MIGILRDLLSQQLGIRAKSSALQLEFFRVSVPIAKDIVCHPLSQSSAAGDISVKILTALNRLQLRDGSLPCRQSRHVRQSEDGFHTFYTAYP